MLVSKRQGARVLSERYDEAWIARANGDEAPAYQFYGVVRAVPVPAGELLVSSLSIMAMLGPRR